jgi:transketolase
MTKKTKKIKKAPKTDLKSTREGFGDGLLEVGEKYPNVVVLTADLQESTKVSKFANKFPERFFDVGVAEQALVTIASGMANYGKIPIISSFAVFVPGRCLEQIRTTIAMNSLPVIIASSHTGFSAGLDGATHQALEDIAVIRSIPNMTVVTPCDYYEAQKAILSAVKLGSPVYLRLERDPTSIITKKEATFKIGRINSLVESKNPQVAIIATGPILNEAVLASKKLEKIGIGSLVLNCHTVKPLDTQAIIHAAKIAGSVVTVEVHQKEGGLGSAVSEILSQNFPVPVGILGVNGVFGETGLPGELLKKHKLNSDGILEVCKKVIKRKFD